MKRLLLFLFMVASFAVPAALAETSAQVLPPTNLDSFVYESAENANNIYGDEGGDDPPSIQNFTVQNRIGTGFTGTTNAGLTTGHGSILPDAWGGDEFIGAEFSMSGPNGGNGGDSGLTITVGPGGVSVSGCLSGCLSGVGVSVSGCLSSPITPPNSCAGGWGSSCSGPGCSGSSAGCSGGCSMSSGCGSGCGSCSGGFAGCGGGCTGGGCSSSGGCSGGGGCFGGGGGGCVGGGIGL
ncbi:MAG TPA: hypothetical protein V6C81_10045 [Planktothrix sp.]|jgi:hypothetical protein